MHCRQIIRLRRRVVEAMTDNQQSLCELERLRAQHIDAWSWKSLRGIYNNLTLGALFWAVMHKLFRN
ncbi:MAG: hypothetical protein K8T91_27510 [Planctomycetes bacterium]|nr:hypothetical protein [Planctomycetota bacterium]